MAANRVQKLFAVVDGAVSQLARRILVRGLGRVIYAQRAVEVPD